MVYVNAYKYDTDVILWAIPPSLHSKGELPHTKGELPHTKGELPHTKTFNSVCVQVFLSEIYSKLPWPDSPAVLRPLHFVGIILFKPVNSP